MALFHHSPYNSPRVHPTKLDSMDDDKQSLISRSSGTPRNEQGMDTLRLVAGNRVRHARCAPEYLEDMAVKGIPESVKKAAAQKFKVIAGQDARTYFKNYVEKHRKKELNSLRKANDTLTNHELPSPVVFAVTVWEEESKCVDYHMTWRGVSKYTRSAEVEDRINSLDIRFKELARALDSQYKETSSLTSYRSASQTKRTTDADGRRRKNRPAPALKISPNEGLAAKHDEIIKPSSPEPPHSATDSVISLPLLNMVRGVPLSHHMPLRVTNPDRLSFISEDAVPVILPVAPVIDKHDIKLSIPERPTHSKHSDSGDSSKWSMDSNLSSDTKSSSSSSRYSSPDTSPGTPPRHAELSDVASRDDSLKFVIVVLGSSLDKDENSWHGLDRHTSIRSVPSERHSPWIGPLARSEYTNDRRRTPIHTPNDSDNESNSDPTHWKNVPVIPLKPLMESLGYVPSAGSHYSPAVVPRYIPSAASMSHAGSSGYLTPASMSNVALPMQNSSPYIYASPRLDSSPYQGAWQQTPLPPSRPPSIAYSAVSHSSPYEYPRSHPF